MQSGIYVGVSAQIALKQRLDALSQNVANMNTTGYRAEEIRFETLLARAGNTQIAFGSAAGSYISTSAGATTKTGNALDVAVSGDAWMAVETPAGRGYTRDGRLAISAAGGLTNLAGQPVLDAGGAPIIIDPNGPPPSIARDGMITQNGVQAGAIGLFTLDPEAPKTRGEGGLVFTEQVGEPVVDFIRHGMAQGFVEGSNVNPMTQMSTLITLQRLFESVSASVESAENTLTEAIRTLGPSNG